MKVMMLSSTMRTLDITRERWEPGKWKQRKDVCNSFRHYRYYNSPILARLLHHKSKSCAEIMFGCEVDGAMQAEYWWRTASRARIVGAPLDVPEVDPAYRATVAADVASSLMGDNKWPESEMNVIIMGGSYYVAEPDRNRYYTWMADELFMDAYRHGATDDLVMAKAAARGVIEYHIVRGK